MKIIVALGILALLLSNSNYASAQAGLIDSSFGVNGQATLPYGTCQSIVMQPDGRSITGNYQYVCRFKANGTLDSTFSNDGYAWGLGYFDIDFALQSDGKLLMSGQPLTTIHFALARYNPDGVLDSSFGTGGQATASFNTIAWHDMAYAIAVQPDGKIVQSGIAWNDAQEGGFGLVRYNSDGSLDNLFGTNGKVLTSFPNGIAHGYDVRIQPDGKIIVGGTLQSFLPAVQGYYYAMARYTATGELDLTFGPDGSGLVTTAVTVPYCEAYTMALQANGKILLAGKTTSNAAIEMRVCRYYANGELDNQFGMGGIASVPLPALTSSYRIMSIVLQSDDKIILVGDRSSDTSTLDDILIVRVNYDGAADSTFGSGGVVYTSLSDSSNSRGYCAALQSDGKLMVGSIVLLRYLTDLNLGIIDLSFQESTLIYPNPISSQATLEYTLTKTENIAIDLVDMQGRLMQTFIDNEIKAAGKQSETLNLNEHLSPGQYIIRIGNGSVHQAVQIIKH